MSLYSPLTYSYGTSFVRALNVINPFPANFLILPSLKTTENKRFPGAFRGHIMGTLVRNQLAWWSKNLHSVLTKLLSSEYNFRDCDTIIIWKYILNFSYMAANQFTFKTKGRTTLRDFFNPETAGVVNSTRPVVFRKMFLLKRG